MRLFVLVLSFVLLLGARARAQDGRPWAAGVTAEQQQAALVLFEQGNTLFTDSQYAAALARYREALKMWDHPAIRYNAAVSLINLDKPLAALTHLDLALHYGEAPLGAENYRQARLFRKLLIAQVAELEVNCTEPGAEVTLDGELLFKGPGHARRRLTPGRHQLTARKHGFLTETRALDLPVGKVTREELKLQAINTVPVREVRRWPVWQPWAVLGGGALLGLAGVPFFVAAENNYETFDAELARICPTGCAEAELPPTLRGTLDRAEVQNGLAVGLFIAGGVTAATGIVLVVLNQPRLEPDRTRAKVAVTPALSPESLGASASFAF